MNATDHEWPRQLAPVSLTANAESIALYAELTSDFNPIHLDAEFAAGTPFGKPIAHGTMVLNLVWISLSETFPRLDLPWAAEIRFLKPVKIGDTVTASGLLSEQPGRYEVAVRNEAGDIVLAGSVQLDAAGRGRSEA
ncbi:MaoC family dehydratase [Rhodoligotrophos ferricapiens]|uniref:MaoC family dehydratase n=1 Tax=Rhodoligotrophos ferricapiens TaxID=3069264 RepID=UPI00315C559C